MGKIIIGGSGITWGRGTPREQVLAEIAQAGFEGAPAGPRGGVTAQETIEFHARFGLKPGPGYLGANFEKPEEEGAILERAHTLGAFMRDIGCTEVYVAAGGFDGYVTSRGKTRRDIAGQVLPEDAMTDAEFEQFAKTLNKVGAITLEYGVSSCFHNHVGSTIETREEIDRLFSMVDHKLVFHGPDIGHLAWAGADPVAYCKDYAQDIKTVHLKDIYPDALKEGLEKKWTYGEFSDNGIFAELGEGMVDFPAMFEILEAAGFEGWIISEIDRTTKATPLESSIICRNYLKGLGY
jgi:inosose dehydratase